jgi:hypothetical protein
MNADRTGSLGEFERGACAKHVIRT